VLFEGIILCPAYVRWGHSQGIHNIYKGVCLDFYMQKRDLYNDKQLFASWKIRHQEEGEEGLTPQNSNILYKYISDMEIGQNVAKGSKKGSRSFRRLNSLRIRLSWIFRNLQERKIEDILRIKEKQIVEFFHEMLSGKLKNQRGESYKSTATYVKVFKAFWHWHQKISRKQGKIIEDITEDLDTKEEQPKFVFLSKENLDLIIPYFAVDDQLIIKFCFDTLIRAPTELQSLKVKNIFEKEGAVWLNVPAEITKTGEERNLNFLFCGDELLKYIKRKNLKPDDYLFDFSPEVFNNKIQKVAKQIWGEKLSDPRAGDLFKNITLYDLRHSGAIHLRVLAKKSGKISLDAIRQRGGWKDFDMLNYYTKFIGIDGDINKNDLLIEEDKTKLEKEISNLHISNKAISKLLTHTINYVQNKLGGKLKQELAEQLFLITEGKLKPIEENEK